MGRKLGFTSLLFSRVAGEPKPLIPTSSDSFSSSCSASPWTWPSCGKTKTLSFRATEVPLPAEESSGEEGSEGVPEGTSEAVLNSLRSGRLFFDPGGGGDTSSIMAEARGGEEEEPAGGFKGGVAVAVDSMDPYGDFRASMEEMVEARGAADWAWLQEMLFWLLRANGKGTHRFIVGAFFDLLIGLAASSSSFSSVPNGRRSLCSSCSSNSSYTFEIEEVVEDNNGNG